MNNGTVSDRDLASLLDRQIEAMQAVVEALEAERGALRARDADALLGAVNTKAARVAAANAIEQDRRTLLAGPGSPPAARTTPREFTGDLGIRSRWQQVISLTQRCRALNDANGSLIRSQQRRIDGALSLMRGEPDGSTAREYGPGGAYRMRHSSRVLGSI